MHLELIIWFDTALVFLRARFTLNAWRRDWGLFPISRLESGSVEGWALVLLDKAGLWAPVESGRVWLI